MGWPGPVRGVVVLAALALVLVVPPPALRAGPLQDARIAFHARTHGRKSPCRPPSEGGTAPVDVPCSRFPTRVKTGEGVDVYLVAARIDPGAGLAALGCGIDYDGREGKGVDVWNWTHCATLDIPVAGSQGPWPAPGAGIQLIWKVDDRCQRRTVPGFEDQGAVALAGVFYCYAYSDDMLSIRPPERQRDNFQLAVVDCAVNQLELQDYAAGRLAFAATAGPEGCNPCLGPCAEKPHCRVEPSRIDFGTVLLGESRDATITVTNLGPAPLRIRPSTPCFQFAVTQGRGIQVLEAGEEARVVVRFTPFTLGVSTCDADMATSCPPVALSAVGEFPEDADGRDLGLVVRGRPGEGRPRVAFRTGEAGTAVVECFDVAGRRVDRLWESWTEAGEHVVEWDRSRLPAGVYFVRARAGGRMESVRVVHIP